MAVIQKQMFRGTAAQLASTPYTVPASTSAIVTNIVVSNTSSSGETVTINLAGVPVISGGVVNGNDAIVLDIRQVLAAGDQITGSGGTNIRIHIGGVEITS